MIFESHAHYDDARFDEDREELLSGLEKKDIEYILNIGASVESSKASVALSEKYDFIYAAVGVHPHDVKEMTDSDLQMIEALSHQRKVVAIGEIGLDYYYDNVSPTVQQLWFEKQIELAKERQLPVIIHSREAAKETMDLMKATAAYKVGGVIHCYSYSLEMAKAFVDMGFSLGIGGVLTFKNSRKLKEVVEAIDLKHLLLETDAPYLTPVPHRGKRNDSSYLTYIASAIADIKQITYEEVIKVTSDNAKALFKVE